METFSLPVDGKVKEVQSSFYFSKNYEKAIVSVSIFVIILEMIKGKTWMISEIFTPFIKQE